VAGSFRHGHGRGCGRYGGERSDLPLRHRQGIIRQSSPGKRVVVDEFAGWSLATPGIASDSNGQIHGFGDHAENSFSIDDQPDTDQHQQNLFQPDSGRFDPIDGSHIRRAARGIRRQDQRCDCSHHSLGPGRDHTPRQRQHFLRIVWNIQRGRRSRLRRQELGKLHLRGRLEQRAGSWIRRNSRLCTTRATNRTCSTAWTFNSQPPTRFT
jgi:hypothetical protein